MTDHPRPLAHRMHAIQLEQELMDLHMRAEAVAREIRIKQDELASHYQTAPTECGYEYVSPTNVVYLKDVGR